MGRSEEDLGDRMSSERHRRAMLELFRHEYQQLCKKYGMTWRMKMSEMEYHTGVLRSLDMSKGLEETAKEICERKGWKPWSVDCSWVEALEDDGHGMYVVVNGIIYEVDDSDIDPYNDVFDAERLSDGTYRYTVKFYNGGCGFSEAVGTAMERLEEQDDEQDKGMEEMAVSEEEDES